MKKEFVLIIAGTVDMEKAHYCERFLELMVDLEVTYHVCNSLNNYF